MAIKKYFIFFLKLAVSSLLLYWIFSHMNLAQVKIILNRISIHYILLFLLAFISLTMLNGWRWKIMSDAYQIPMSHWFSQKWSFIALFFNNVLPAGIGGDGFRVYASIRQNGKIAKSFAVVFYDRAISFLTLNLMGFIVLFFLFDFKNNLWLYGIFSISTILFIVLFFIPQLAFLMKFIEKIFPFGFVKKIFFRMNEAKLQKEHIRAVLASFALAIVLQLLMIYAHFVVSSALQLSVSFAHLVVFVPLYFLAVVFSPFTVNGIGIREIVFKVFLTQIGMLQEEAILFALIFFTWELILSLSGGVLYLLNRNKSFNK